MNLKNTNLFVALPILKYSYSLFGPTIKIYIYTWGSLNKFPDFFCMGTFIDSTHMKL